MFFKLSGSSLTILNLHLLIWFGSQFAGLCLVLFFGRFSVGGAVALYYFPLLQISSLFMCAAITILIFHFLLRYISTHLFYFVLSLTCLFIIFQTPIMVKHFLNYQPQSALIVPGKPLKMELNKYTQPLAPFLIDKKEDICSVVKDLSYFSLDQILIKFGNVDPYSGVMEKYPGVISPRIYSLIKIKEASCKNKKMLTFTLFQDNNNFKFDFKNINKDFYNNSRIKFLNSTQQQIKDCKKLGFGSHSYFGTNWAKIERLFFNFLGLIDKKEKYLIINNNQIIIQSGTENLFQEFVCLQLSNEKYMAIDVVNRDIFVYLVEPVNNRHSEVLATYAIDTKDKVVIKIKKNEGKLYLIINEKPYNLSLNGNNILDAINVLKINYKQ